MSLLQCVVKLLCVTSMAFTSPSGMESCLVDVDQEADDLKVSFLQTRAQLQSKHVELTEINVTVIVYMNGERKETQTGPLEQLLAGLSQIETVPGFHVDDIKATDATQRKHEVRDMKPGETYQIYIKAAPVSSQPASLQQQAANKTSSQQWPQAKGMRYPPSWFCPNGALKSCTNPPKAAIGYGRKGSFCPTFQICNAPVHLFPMGLAKPGCCNFR